MSAPTRRREHRRETVPRTLACKRARALLCSAHSMSRSGDEIIQRLPLATMQGRACWKIRRLAIAHTTRATARFRARRAQAAHHAHAAWSSLDRCVVSRQRAQRSAHCTRARARDFESLRASPATTHLCLSTLTQGPALPSTARVEAQSQARCRCAGPSHE
jgi:hypothetical protein